MSAEILFSGWKNLPGWMKCMALPPVLAGLALGFRMVLVGYPSMEISEEDLVAFAASRPEFLTCCPGLSVPLARKEFHTHRELKDMEDYLEDWDDWVPTTWAHLECRLPDGRGAGMMLKVRRLGPFSWVPAASFGPASASGWEVRGSEAFRRAAHAWFIQGKRPASGAGL